MHTPESLRSQFPILHQEVNGHPLIYFDNAATTQKPRAVIDAVCRYYERDNANVHRGLHELSNRSTDKVEAVRAQTAAFFGAGSAEEIIFTRGTTESINLAAAMLAPCITGQSAILLTEMEHHSNLVPWQMLAQRTGAALKFLPVTERGELDPEAAAALMTDEVRIFAFTHASNTLGTINDATALCRMARERGIRTVVDGAQSAGHLPVNVSEIGCDFYACSGHKMAAPTGIGLLYGRRELMEHAEPWQGGGGMIESVKWERSTWAQLPGKFEAGTPDVAGIIGFGAALTWLEEIGLEWIARHSTDLAAYAMERLRTVPGITVLGPPDGPNPRGGVVSFHLEAAHPHDLVTFADGHGLALRGGHHCNQPLMRKLGRPGTTRASFYVYNTAAEVDRMVEILHAACRYFG